jgi:hypothetical protein
MNENSTTTISCSDPDLISADSVFIKENVKLLSKYEENNVEFEHEGWEFHYKLSEFSIKHPSETFHVIDIEEIDLASSVEYTLDLKNGNYNIYKCQAKLLCNGAG